MRYVTVLSSELSGYLNSPLYKYCDPPNGPSDSDVHKGFITIQNFLDSKGQRIEDRVNYLPFIDLGIITTDAGISLTRYKGLLVGNAQIPRIRSLSSILIVAGLSTEQQKVTETFEMLKSLIIYSSYWKDFPPKHITVDSGGEKALKNGIVKLLTA